MVTTDYDWGLYHPLAHQVVECQACLEDRIVGGRDDVDAGMIFGTGFAPFRGGPMYYLASRPGGQKEKEND